MSEGKLAKLKIIAYKDPGFEELKTGVEETSTFVVDVNPENYTQEIKLQMNNAQAPGTSSAQPRFVFKPPEELSFEILFDGTGIINGKPEKDISEKIESLRTFLMGYVGEIHQPLFFEILWGKKLFKCNCTGLNISYKLFNPDGTPTRAVCKLTFKQLEEENLRVANERRKSPDLTHYRTVKKGDLLPLMCYKIYGNSKYYMQVAEVNKLSNFRDLTPGTEIFFPPIDKTKN